MKVNERGRALKITTELLIQGSCGIGKPFGDGAKKLAEYLAKGETTKLRRRLEADVRSLFALYEYGRLHGSVRLRWGFVDDGFGVPWVHRDEPTLDDLMTSAFEMGVPLEVVVGRAPAWDEPWARGRRADVLRHVDGYEMWLFGEDGFVIERVDVQRARLPVAVH